MTLLEIFERIGRDNLTPGTQVGVVDGSGREFVITMGEVVAPPEPAPSFHIA